MATPGPRKLVGVMMLAASIIIYPALASLVHGLYVSAAPMWAQLVYLAVAGLGWVFPAMWIIRWMSKPA